MKKQKKPDSRQYRYTNKDWTTNNYSRVYFLNILFCHIYFKISVHALNIIDFTHYCPNPLLVNKINKPKI